MFPRKTMADSYIFVPDLLSRERRILFEKARDIWSAIYNGWEETLDKQNWDRGIAWETSTMKLLYDYMKGDDDWVWA